MSRVVTFGEIMARLAAPGFKRFQQAMPGTLDVTFAGAEASIAASIAFLGGDAAFVTALPEHAIADACVANLRSLGVNTRHILRTPQGRLGLYFLETGANQRPGNVIYDREGSAIAITPATDYDWNAIFAGAEWFIVSGITPAISRNAADVTLIALREASQRGVKVAIDMNYRSKLWQ
jgi:2-dehydro-3-deoxygluconokinase